ncbi:hypothetical protein RUM43_012713 [Polyplax serrata]|uniref:Uncharacterized protein n=1 Tax=Polyplax serrata TaxID=468196 RepID=A0AAN8RZ98_POLSC
MFLMFTLNLVRENLKVFESFSQFLESHPFERRLPDCPTATANLKIFSITVIIIIIIIIIVVVVIKEAFVELKLRWLSNKFHGYLLDEDKKCEKRDKTASKGGPNKRRSFAKFSDSELLKLDKAVERQDWPPGEHPKIPSHPLPAEYAGWTGSLGRRETMKIKKGEDEEKRGRRPGQAFFQLILFGVFINSDRVEFGDGTLRRGWKSSKNLINAGRK